MPPPNGQDGTVAVWDAKARKQASRRILGQNWKLALIPPYAGFRNALRQTWDGSLIDAPKESG